jgi:ribonuclease-3
MMRQKKNSNPFEKFFKNKALLESALTHPSYGGEKMRRSHTNFERLEFLGDSVLGLVISNTLFRHRPTAQEGELSHARSHLVSRHELYERAQAIGLGTWLKMKSRAKRSKNPKILADALEALIGALFLEGGLHAAERFIQTLFSKRMAETEQTKIENPKGKLQELVQKTFHLLPDYLTQAHKKGFESAVSTPFGKSRGIGLSKKAAEEAAATKMLEAIRKKNFSKTRRSGTSGGGRRGTRKSRSSSL